MSSKVLFLLIYFILSQSQPTIMMQMEAQNQSISFPDDIEWFKVHGYNVIVRPMIVLYTRVSKR